MKNFSYLFPMCFLASAALAQPTIEWQKKIGGSGDDYTSSIIQTSDGGYAAFGLSNSHDGDVSGVHGDEYADIWLVKLDMTGNIQWQKTYGGSNYENAFFFQQTKDGGYVFAASIMSSDGDVTNYYGESDCWVVKLDAYGNIQWEKTLGTSGYEDAGSVNQTADGGYLVLAMDHYAHYWLIKLDALGNVLWQRFYGGSNHELPVSLCVTKDKGCVMTGSSWSSDGDVTGHHGTIEGDYWVVKVDSMGVLQWQKCLGGSRNEQSFTIIQTAEGEYLVSGFSYSIDGDITGHHDPTGLYQDPWIVKLSQAGQIQWQRSLGGSGDDYIYGGINQTLDGGFILAGFTRSNDGDIAGGNHGDGDAWILKLSNAGAIEWQKLIGGSNSDGAISITQTTDGGYIFSGDSYSTDGDVTTVGHGSGECWIVKLSPDIVGTKDLPVTPAKGLEISPNPANIEIKLRIGLEEMVLDVCISDMLGHQISRQKIQNGGSFDVSRLPNSVYTVMATTPSGKIFTSELKKQD